MIESLKKNETKLVFLFLFVCLGICTGICFLFDGTRDSGDSVMHYLMSRYSWQHPELFLNHWGKPIFTLLSSPFSQAGFTGIKMFNVLLSFGSAALMYDAARRSGFLFAWAIPFFIYFAPFLFLSQFSGLTEPLFAFVLSLAIWLQTKDKTGFAMAVVSFLPFVRSEGIMVLLAWGLFLLLTKGWKYIPFLALGNVLFAFIGLFHYKTLFWYFTENPYNVAESNYGSGTWGHFPEKYFFIAGIPIAILTLVGIIAWLISFGYAAMASTGMRKMERHCLVYGSFLIYFIAHVLFWRFGIFHSMGLERVMVAILPIGAWIAAQGLEKIFWLANIFHAKVATAITFIIVLYVILFPFSPNPAAFKLPRDLELQTDQKAIAEMAVWLDDYLPGPKIICTANPSVSHQLGLDPFDENQVISLGKIAMHPPGNGAVVIWDNWFGPVEAAMSRDFLDSDPRYYEFLKCFVKETQNKKSEICVYLINDARL